MASVVINPIVENSVVVGHKFNIISGNAFLDVLPRDFAASWSREDHERLAATSSTYLESVPATADVRALFDSMMDSIFAVPDVEHVEFKVNAAERDVEATAHYGGTRVLLDRAQRITEALFAFNDTLTYGTH